MKKLITDYDLKDKKVIIRCDFNVPIKDNIIEDDSRIVASIPTIKYAIEQGAKVILMSHLGKVKEEHDKAKNTLKPVALALGALLNTNIMFCPVTRGEQLENMINSMESKDVLLIENTRFEDLEGKKESSNDEELGKYWASLGDIFINDAYGSSHRAHASTVGIPTYLQSGIGFLVKKEVEVLESIVENPERPLVIIMGGSKVIDKIGLIKNFILKADKIIIGGGMAYTFIHALGYDIGKSLLDEDSVDFCRDILKDFKDKIILPIDVVVAKEFANTNNYKEVTIDKIEYDDYGMDIGSKTLDNIKDILRNSKTVIWNGPMGVFEMASFSKGTIGVCDILNKIDAKVIIGGGDSASAVKKFGYGSNYYHISTGGGATLEFLEGKELPGIKVISEV